MMGTIYTRGYAGRDSAALQRLVQTLTRCSSASAAAPVALVASVFCRQWTVEERLAVEAFAVREMPLETPPELEEDHLPL